MFPYINGGLGVGDPVFVICALDGAEKTGIQKDCACKYKQEQDYMFFIGSGWFLILSLYPVISSFLQEADRFSCFLFKFGIKICRRDHCQPHI